MIFSRLKKSKALRLERRLERKHPCLPCVAVFERRKRRLFSKKFRAIKHLFASKKRTLIASRDACAPVIALFLLIFAASAETSLACAKTENGAPVCALWTRADVAFLGKVLKTESAPRSEDLAEGARKIRFQVLENYKGADNPTFTVIVKPDCGANIKSGQTWIIYASSDIVLKTFSAFRAARVEPKIPNAETETLKNIVSGKSETAVAGQFVNAAQNLYAFEPVEITVTGGGKLFTAKSDADGAFNIAVPDGRYTVELKFPYKANLKWDENLLGASFTEGVPTVFKYEVKLNDGDCHFALFEVLRKP